MTGAPHAGEQYDYHVAMMRLLAYARDVPGGVIVVEAGAGFPVDAGVATSAPSVVDASDSPLGASARHLQ